jgi:hypothetical protein
MASVYDSGPQCIVQVRVASATVVNKGDTVCIDGDYAVPAGDMNDSGDAAANRETCADHFFGIAQVASANGETDDLAVDVSQEAVYQVNLATAATLSYRAELEPYSDGGACSDNTFVAGTTSPVFTVVERTDSGQPVRALMKQTWRLANT